LVQSSHKRYIGEPMKKVASVLAVSFGLLLSCPMLAHAGSNTNRAQTQQQKAAEKQSKKTWKQYSRGQSKAQKQQAKQQKKQMKDWKKTHNSTTTVT
jgi:hypothetical protein